MLGSSTGSSESPPREGDQATPSSVRQAWARPVDMKEDIHSELLLRVQKSTPPRRDYRVYKLRELPDDIQPGLEKSEKSTQQNPAKLDNFTGAAEDFRNLQRIQPFGPTENPSIFRMLQVDAAKLLNLAHVPEVFGSLQSGATYMPYGTPRTDLGDLGPWGEDLMRRRRTPSPPTKL